MGQGMDAAHLGRWLHEIRLLRNISQVAVYGLVLVSGGGLQRGTAK